jgi:hypothetical protein
MHEREAPRGGEINPDGFKVTAYLRPVVRSGRILTDAYLRFCHRQSPQPIFDGYYLRRSCHFMPLSLLDGSVCAEDDCYAPAQYHYDTNDVLSACNPGEEISDSG